MDVWAIAGCTTLNAIVQEVVILGQKVDQLQQTKQVTLGTSEMKIDDIITEDLRAWFGKGKKGGAGGGGWDRYNTKGERIGKCGDSKPGEGKPKCLSKSAAAKLRNSDTDKDGKKDGKKAIANAVKRKKANDPNRNRKGKAKHVNNSPKK